MATAIFHHRDDLHRHDDRPNNEPREDDTNLETLEQLALIRDSKDKLTPIDVLFTSKAKEGSSRPGDEPRKFF